MLAHSNGRELFSVNITTEMWHPVSWNSTSQIDNAWGEFPRSGYSLNYSRGLETTLLHMWFAVLTLLVYCYSLCGCCLWTVCGCCCSTMPKRISTKKKLQLAEATKRRKLLYTSITGIINNCCSVLSQQNI